jgi:hypothetical protein
VNFAGLIEQIALLNYRLSSHALLNWADDPALLAIVFC